MTKCNWIQLTEYTWQNVAEYRWHIVRNAVDKMWINTVDIWCLNRVDKMWLNKVDRMWLNTVDTCWLNWVVKMRSNTFDKIWRNSFGTPSWFLFKWIWSLQSDFINIWKNLLVYTRSKPYELILHLPPCCLFTILLTTGPSEDVLKERFAMASGRRLS